MSQLNVIIEPSNCSKCKTAVNGGRFLKCGCVLCATCATSKKLRTMITCPTCLYQYNLTSGDIVGYYHQGLSVADITAQKRRLQFYRNKLLTVENGINEVSESDPLSGDLDLPSHLGNPVDLSASSLEITSSASDITDEYLNTEYALVAARLAKLIAKGSELTASLATKTAKARARAAKAKAKPEEKEAERQLAISTEKARRRTERRALSYDRRLRLLANQDAELDEVKVVKIKLPLAEGEEEEPEPEDDEDEEGAKKKDPYSIEEVKLLVTGEKGYFVKLNYTQRWRLKVDSWKQWKNLYAEKEALLEELHSKAIAREDDEVDSVKGAKRVAVLRSRLTKLRKSDEAITSKIDNRIAKLEKREKHVPGKTVLNKKLQKATAEKLYLFGQFYPDRLPKVEVVPDEEEDY